MLSDRTKLKPVNDEAVREWKRVCNCPLAGLELCVDGSFRLGDRRHSAGTGLCNHRLGPLSVDKEPGIDRPLVLGWRGGTMYLLYREGTWYQNNPWPIIVETVVSDPAADMDHSVPGKGLPAESPNPSAILSYVEPGAMAVGKKERPGRRKFGLFAPLLLIAAISTPSILYQLPDVARLIHAETLALECRFDEATWAEAERYHTIITYALLHTTIGELCYFGAGLLIFGWLAQRRAGVVRTLLLFAFCSGSGIGLWQFAKTPMGQNLIVESANRLASWAAERKGLETGWTVWIAYQEAWSHMLSLQGPVWGAGAALAGLAVFTGCRRGAGNQFVDVRWPMFVLTGAYLALGMYLWAEIAKRDLLDLPWVVYLGGALGGLFFVVPEKILREVGPFLTDKVLNSLLGRISNRESD